MGNGLLPNDYGDSDVTEMQANTDIASYELLGAELLKNVIGLHGEP